LGEDLESKIKFGTFRCRNFSLSYSRDGRGEKIRISDSKTGEDLEFGSEQEFRDWASRDPSRAEYVKILSGSMISMDEVLELQKKMKEGRKFYLDSDYSIREWSSGNFESGFPPALILREGESPEHEENEGGIKQNLEQMCLAKEKGRDEENVLRALGQVLRDLQCSELSESEIRRMADVYGLGESGIRKLFGMLDGNPEIRKRRKGFLGIFGEKAYCR